MQVATQGLNRLRLSLRSFQLARRGGVAPGPGHGERIGRRSTTRQGIMSGHDVPEPWRPKVYSRDVLQWDGVGVGCVAALGGKQAC